MHNETGKFCLSSRPTDEEKILRLLSCLTPGSAAPRAGRCSYLGPERGDRHIFSGDAEQHDARQSRCDHQPGGKEFTPRHEALSPFAESKEEAAEQQTDSNCFLHPLKRGERRGWGQALTSAQPQATGTTRSAWAKLRCVRQVSLPSLHTVNRTRASCPLLCWLCKGIGATSKLPQALGLR